MKPIVDRISGRISGLPRAGPSDLRQALRVMAGATAAFAAYRLLDLPQGYWAVFTVVIVMQGSIGGTLGAALDRLAGTIAGALVGGAAAISFPRTALGVAVALALVTGLTALAAAVRPQLRVAPITAAIVLLSQPAHLSTEGFVLDRILEIALGGFIGVATSMLVFPARARGIVIDRSAAVLERVHDLLLIQVEGLERREALSFSPAHAALRKALAAIEQGMTDAERERSSRLGHHDIPDALPRTLWRVRNDLVQIVRALDQPLPGPIAEALVPAAAALLRAQAALAERCTQALRAGSPVAREDLAGRHDAFSAAFDGLRKAGLIRPLDFDTAGRVFGLAFSLEQLHRDLDDLADRIDEIGAPRSR